MLLKSSLFSTTIIHRLILCLLLAFTTSVAHAKDDKDDEITLGRTLLLGIGDHPATIPLIICRQAKYIKIKAERDVSVERVVVTYGDDKTRTVRFDTDIEKDKHSEWKSLGARRCVKKLRYMEIQTAVKRVLKY
ncbi:DUF2541 family protein [Shewanella seohaensis]|uniref:DUF2541 family protein n=1 Tax=Shewanella seohaensis TaxID=755175 RepID=UPI0021C823EC|nr:DUF2541 family protein [Shewanella seohaensis]UXM82110.1 DUF2541 family protein [Shewanella seohaensis]